jgi:hypothetical protein
MGEKKFWRSSYRIKIIGIWEEDKGSKVMKLFDFELNAFCYCLSEYVYLYLLLYFRLLRLTRVEYLFE